MSYSKIHKLTVQKDSNNGTKVEENLEKQHEEKPRVEHQRVITEPVAGDVKLSVGNITKVSKKTTPEQIEHILEKRNMLLSGFSSKSVISAPVSGSIVDEMFNFDFASDSSSDEESSGFKPS